MVDLLGNERQDVYLGGESQCQRYRLLAYIVRALCSLKVTVSTLVEIASIAMHRPLEDPFARIFYRSYTSRCPESASRQLGSPVFSARSALLPDLVI